MDALQKHHQCYIEFFEQLTPERLQELETLFAERARFKDPFNDVYGSDAIRRVFEHMFATTKSPRFVVLNAAVEQTKAGGCLLLVWDFSFQSKSGRDFFWQGSSRVSFDNQDKVTEHIDYWDPAEAIYDKTPLLGVLTRAIKRRLTA